MIDAKIIADSVSESGVRLITMQLRYHRFIHPEFLTHRMFSRNASSSRAIPVSKLISDVEQEIAMPVFWGKNQKGMQAIEELSHGIRVEAIKVWLEQAKCAIEAAKELSDLGVHKQIANRILEPFSAISVVNTGTDEAYSNFFALRNHKDAQPEIQTLAKVMLLEYKNSTPVEMPTGHWHLPYITNEDVQETSSMDWESQCDVLCKVSAARCARVSYLRHDNTKPSILDDMDLYMKLVGSKPLHASPTEHQAQAVKDKSYKSGNFHGWLQYRKTLANEYVIGLES